MCHPGPYPTVTYSGGTFPGCTLRGPQPRITLFNFAPDSYSLSPEVPSGLVFRVYTSSFIVQTNHFHPRPGDGHPLITRPRLIMGG